MLGILFRTALETGIHPNLQYQLFAYTGVSVIGMRYNGPR